MSELKTSEEWLKEQDRIEKVLDPDGWDRSNFQYSFYEEKISKEEFDKRVFSSTCMFIGSDFLRVTRWMCDGLQDLILEGNKEKTVELAREHFGEEYIIHGKEEVMSKKDFYSLPEWEG